jgi:UDP-N-acetylglucosamine--N-acetylmuramyl-(pentapeptide) pyrophosphoryl-undecaprenol N-acetylglucosamine transferase
MKIVFTGGGTGGHFYPIIAVAERVNQVVAEENIVNAELYYVSDDPYDREALFEHNLEFVEVRTGKMRRYFSVKNFFDIFKTFGGLFQGFWKIFSLYPDVIFGKGGYASFPTMVAARILRIPVIIHESDSAPGVVNKWSGRFAKRVAVSFEEAGKYFPPQKVAWTGQPVRMELENAAAKEKALEYFKLEQDRPVVLILGGSQGAELINNAVLDALPRLVQSYQVIHQTGVRNFKTVSGQADVILTGNSEKGRYNSTAFLNPLAMKMAAGAADIIISRAGSTLFEIASWGVPSILIPFNKSNGDHAKKNAFNYARAGACSVIEEMNMTGNILMSEIDRILGDEKTKSRMASSAKAFYKPDAAKKIARELVDIALSHEK